MFALVVDDFALKYISQDNALHLMQDLKDKYEDVEVNWDGNKLCGINLQWDYVKRQCKLNLKGYIDKFRQRFNLTPVKFPNMHRLIILNLLLDKNSNLQNKPI